MTRRSAAAFHQLPEGCVDCSKWQHALNENQIVDTESLLHHWDYFSKLVFRRHLTVDWTAAQKALDFSGPFDLEVVVELGSGRGRPWREVLKIERIPLKHGSAIRELAVEVPAQLVSHQLSARTSILLQMAGTAGSLLSPSVLGSRLWSDLLITRVEGDDPRFPMEIVDFNEHFAGRNHRHAPWFVSWTPAGSHREFRSALRLYLNANQQAVLERVQAQDPPTLQAIMSDVVSQVCGGILRSADHPSELDDAEEGSLEDQARHWLKRAFESVEEARSMLDQRPGEFRASLLASVRFDS